MKVQQLAGAALFAVVAIGLVSWSLLTTKREQNQQQEKVELEQKLPFLQVTGKIGGEKVGFLSDLEVIRILRERYRLEVKAQKSGSLAMMHTSIEGLDFLWPASRGSAELFRGQARKVEDVMNSPIVVFSWRTVAEALAKPVSLPSSGVSGAGAEQAKPIVEKIGDSHLVLDMPHFVAAMEAKLPWKQVGLPELFGSVKVKLTSPAESNSGYAFTGLLMNTMNGGEIPDAAAAMQLTPRVERLYRAMGRLEDSSGTLFKVYLSQGLGAHPMVVAYENQLIEFSQENPQLVDTVRSQIAVLYPRPTTWASHPMIALSEGGKRLLEALTTDPDLKKIAWERHGFRVGLMSNNVSLPPSLKEIGIAPAIQSVQEMPTTVVMEQVLQAVSGR